MTRPGRSEQKTGAAHNPFIQRLEHGLPLIAILRGVRTQEALAIGKALVEIGFEIIEVPLNSPAPLATIETLAAELGERALIGAGTVTRVSEVTDVQAAGGRLIVSPHCDAAIIQSARRAEMACVPGFLTPSEALTALAAGPDALKLFPADVAPPQLLQTLLAVLPATTRVLPVGGITPQQIEAYRAAGAAGFGLGSALYRPGMTADEVRRRGLAFAGACRPPRAAAATTTDANRS